MPVNQIPAGMTAAELWAAAEHGSRPRRRNPVQDALEGGGMVFHPITEEREAS